MISLDPAIESCTEQLTHFNNQIILSQVCTEILPQCYPTCCARMDGSMFRYGDILYGVAAAALLFPNMEVLPA